MNGSEALTAHHMRNSVIYRLNQSRQALRIPKPRETLVRSRNGLWLTYGDSFALAACEPSPLSDLFETLAPARSVRLGSFVRPQASSSP
jgi:hypothetical protein